MRARSIPEEHDAKVLHLYLEGKSYRTIADRLNGDHALTTSPGSVHRLIERIAEGDSTDSVVRAVVKLRLKAPQLVDDLDAHVAMANTRAGIDEDMVIQEDVKRADIDFAIRVLIRRLKVAGCLGADADRALLRLRRLADERCREEELEAQEAPAAATESQPRPIPQPPPEPVRASSNGHFSGRSPVDLAAGNSGGGPPCPPKAVSEPSRPRPFVAPPKQGRNESCACGSHRKFKKCCGSPTIPPHVTAALQALAS